MRLIALGTVLPCFLVLAGCSSSDDTPFPQLVNEFVTNSLAFSPVSASSNGYHTHQGQPLDGLVDDFSEENIAKMREFYTSFAKRLDDREASGKLSAQDRADVSLMRGVINQSLVEFDVVQRYRHDPTFYTDLTGSALFNPLMLEYAPLDKRFEHIVARMKALPALLGQAQRNLLDSPQIKREVALAANDSNRLLIVTTLKERVPEGVKLQLESASTEALRAIDAFAKFLREDLAGHVSDWRLGQEKYDKQFSAVLGIGATPDQLYADAKDELERVRQAAAALALPMHDKMFKSQTGTADQMVRRVLDKIAERHATPESYISDAKRDLEEATAFVAQKGFVPLPENKNLQVVPTPEFLRGVYAVGGFNSAPALEPKLGAFYWITPIPATWEKARIESKLREYNRWGLKILTIHEAMPGHWLQFEFANTVQPAERRVLRGLYGSGPYVEGWGVYSTELMIDQGYLLEEPEMRLNWYKQLLRAIANTILDIGLHTKGMSEEDALSLMIDKTYQEKEEAEAKMVRAKLTSTQLPTYFAGWREWQRIRDEEKKRLGGNFNLRAFHEKSLKLGGVRLADLPALLKQ